MRLSRGVIESTPLELADLQLAEEHLRRSWGYHSFQTGQLLAIKEILRGRDTLVLLPTGGGKSICFQVPGLCMEGLTLVVSPLVSLIRDQVDALQRRGIRAAGLESGLSSSTRDRIFRKASSGSLSFLYLSPERLQTVEFVRWAGRLDVCLLVIDEAHCISEWGHEFRPSYRDIPACYRLVGRPPVVALTATATPDVQRDICTNLQLRNPAHVCGGFDRPNIVFSVFNTFGRRFQLNEILRRVPGSAIVYASTRRSVDKLTRQLRLDGHTAVPFHAGLNDSDKQNSQSMWTEDRSRIIVATSAFGMGIDKPNVRTVTHFGLPSSLEGYYQEAGRAGRDRKKAYATILIGQEDVRRHRVLIRSSKKRNLIKRFAIRNPAAMRLTKMVRYALSTACRRRVLLAHFGEHIRRGCAACDVCLHRHHTPIMKPSHERLCRHLLLSAADKMAPEDNPVFSSIPHYKLDYSTEWLMHTGYLQRPRFPNEFPIPTSLGHFVVFEDSADRVRGYREPQMSPVHR